MGDICSSAPLPFHLCSRLSKLLRTRRTDPLLQHGLRHRCCSLSLPPPCNGSSSAYIRASSFGNNTGLPADAVFLGPSRLLYSASCLEPPAQLYAGEVHWEQPQQHDGSHLVVHGFAGYFTCHLFGGIKLDTRHESPERNVYHWESMFFPLSFPLDPDGICFGVRLERRSGFKSLSLHGDSRRIRGVGEFVPLVSLSEPDLASRRTELYAQWYEWQLLLPDCRNRSLEAHCLVHNRVHIQD